MRSTLGVVWSLVLVGSLTAADVPIWSRWEISFAAKPTDKITVHLTPPSGATYVVDGFAYDDKTQRCRYIPDELGEWKFSTNAEPKQGTFKVVANKGTDRFSRHGDVRVRGTHLAHADGTPFFWLGDTVWNAATNSTAEEWADYLKIRAGQHFNGVQVVIHTPWRCAKTDLKGNLAFTKTDKGLQINTEYYKQIDERLDAANAAGFLVAPVLIWAHKKGDSGIDLSDEEVVQICQYEIARYQGNHVMWMLAGDNSYNKVQAERWKKIGRTVFAHGGGRIPVTTHPTGTNWPWEGWRNEPWLTVYGYQSGHGDDDNTWKWIHQGPPAQNWNKTPTRPIINLEPPYEGHISYQGKKPQSPFNVRRATYWSLLVSPPAGVTYGGHGVWSWQKVDGEVPIDHPGSGEALAWRKAVEMPGAQQMKVVYDTFQSLKWWTLRPVKLQRNPTEAKEAITAAKDEEGSLFVAYTPMGKSISTAGISLKPGLTANWVDPISGKTQPATAKEGIFTVPDAKQDWLLIVK
jgi:hypothetical protein